MLELPRRGRTVRQIEDDDGRKSTTAIKVMLLPGGGSECCMLGVSREQLLHGGHRDIRVALRREFGASQARRGVSGGRRQGAGCSLQGALDAGRRRVVDPKWCSNPQDMVGPCLDHSPCIMYALQHSFVTK